MPCAQGLTVASLAAGVYAAARPLGLTGLGRQTDPTEQPSGAVTAEMYERIEDALWDSGDRIPTR